MRIGEITIIGPPGSEKETFIASVCQKLEMSNEKVCFGRFLANEQLGLHLYGISVQKEEPGFAWDLISRKILGYIIMFNWYQPESLEAIRPTLDFFSAHYEAPMLVVANIGTEPEPISEKFYRDGIPIACDRKFTFCKVSEPRSARQAIAMLLTTIIEKIP